MSRPEHIQDAFDQLIESFSTIKDYVRRTNPQLFERWKAGGYAISGDFVSMYPNIETVMELLGDDYDEDEDELEEIEEDDERFSPHPLNDLDKLPWTYPH